MTSKQFVYSGCDNLEAMTEAVRYNNFLVDVILKNIKEKETKKILDFGAGSGTYALMLRQKKINVDCLEPDKELKSRLKMDGFKVLGKSTELEPSTYDLIYALNVFEHIKDDFSEISKLAGALKKNGTLIIYVPAYNLLFSSMDEKVGHYRRYRADRLRRLANKGGLSIEQISFYDPVGFFAAFAYRLIGGEGTLSSTSVRNYDKYLFPVSRILHPITKKILGKNVVLVAKKK